MLKHLRYVESRAAIAFILFVTLLLPVRVLKNYSDALRFLIAKINQDEMCLLARFSKRFHSKFGLNEFRSSVRIFGALGLNYALPYASEILVLRDVNAKGTRESVAPIVDKLFVMPRVETLRSNEPLDSEDKFHQVARSFITSLESNFSLIDFLIQKRGVFAGPTGRFRFVSSSLHWDRTFHQFESINKDQEDFIVLSGMETGQVCGVYFPISNFAYVRDSCARLNTDKTFKAMLVFAIANKFGRKTVSTDVVSKEPGYSGEATNYVIGCLGGVENYAHQLMDSYSGLERLIEKDLLRGIDEIAVFGSEFFGSTYDLFPEIRQLKVSFHKARWSIEHDANYQGNHFTNVGDHGVSERLKNRVIQRALSEPLPEGLGMIEHVAQKSETW